MSEWTKLPRPQCEAVAQMPVRHTYPAGGPPYRCIRAAEWRHEATGRLVCWQHRAALEYRKKPVEFVSANAAPDGTVRAGVVCRECGRARGLVNGLCDDCTLKKHGCLLPWLKDGTTHYRVRPRASVGDGSA